MNDANSPIWRTDFDPDEKMTNDTESLTEEDDSLMPLTIQTGNMTVVMVFVEHGIFKLTWFDSSVI